MGELVSLNGEGGGLWGGGGWGVGVGDEGVCPGGWLAGMEGIWVLFASAWIVSFDSL